MKIHIAICAAAFSCSVSGQSTFQNLDFEQANPVTIVDTPYVTAASALPDWTVTIGEVQQTQITENDPSTGAPWVMLVGPGSDSFGIAPIDGNYSVLLQGSFSGSASISQTGLIPAGMQSLLFEAEAIQGGPVGTLQVQVGTQTVSFTAVGTGANYTLYGGNISAWAGDTEQLTFSALEDSSGLNNWIIDDISFSTEAVPEPSPLALTGIGGLLFALWRRFEPKRP